MYLDKGALDFDEDELTKLRQNIERIIDQGLGRSKADLVLKGGRFLNVASGEIAKGDIAICGDRVVGTYD